MGLVTGSCLSLTLPCCDCLKFHEVNIKFVFYLNDLRRLLLRRNVLHPEHAAVKVWPNVGLPLTVLVSSKPSCSKEGQQEKQQQGPHGDAMAGPNQFTTCTQKTQVPSTSLNPAVASRLKDLPRSCDLQVERTTCRPNGVWTPWNSFLFLKHGHSSFITCRILHFSQSPLSNQ